MKVKLSCVVRGLTDRYPYQRFCAILQCDGVFTVGSVENRREGAITGSLWLMVAFLAQEQPSRRQCLPSVCLPTVCGRTSNGLFILFLGS